MKKCINYLFDNIKRLFCESVFLYWYYFHTNATLLNLVAFVPKILNMKEIACLVILQGLSEKNVDILKENCISYLIIYAL